MPATRRRFIQTMAGGASFALMGRRGLRGVRRRTGRNLMQARSRGVAALPTLPTPKKTETGTEAVAQAGAG